MLMASLQTYRCSISFLRYILTHRRPLKTYTGNLNLHICKSPLSFKIFGDASKKFDIPILLSILKKDKDQLNLFLIYNREVKPSKVLTQGDEESDIATPKAKSPTKVRTKSEYQSGDVKLFQNRITSKRQRRGTLGVKDEETYIIYL
jgi:hypothetical protein